jgi:histidine triad (HIT) family protein
MDNCIFCNIAKGEIQANKVYEDELVVAFLDIHPKAPGHTLLIPKEHSRWFYELSDSLSDHLFRVAKNPARELKEKHQAELVRLSIVGDEVPHTHIHLIPA